MIVSLSSQSCNHSRFTDITIEASSVFSRPAGRGRAYIDSTDIYDCEGRIMSFQHDYKIMSINN